jgi:hypothetical protein
MLPNDIEAFSTYVDALQASMIFVTFSIFRLQTGQVRLCLKIRLAQG